jgi:hypothetical protein
MVTFRSATCGVAFKEWAGICDALSDGRQALLLRKGGIRESGGAGGFVPEYREFWLYPTWSHQAEQGLRTAGSSAPPAHAAAGDRAVPISALVDVELIGYVETEEALRALEPFHQFTTQTIFQRFHYRRPGLWALSARVWRRDRPFILAPTPEQAGCKTWALLEKPLPTTGVEPVLTDDQWTKTRDRLRSILDREH